MKTVGQRIAQARREAGMRGIDLAIAVGYKHASSIGAIEARTTGQGGHHVDRIADALRVPLQWLLEGPDGPVVPFIPRPTPHAQPAPQPYPTPPPTEPLRVSEPAPPSYIAPMDASIAEAIQLFRQLTTTQRAETLAHMQRQLSARTPCPPSTAPRADHPTAQQSIATALYKLSACN